MNPSQLVEQIVARKWVAVAAVLIGLIVRLLKSDTKIPIDIPPRLRAPLALALGAAAGVLDKLSNMQGVTWTTAILEGVTAAFFAIVGHVFFVDSARDGKEFVVPGLTQVNTPPGPGKPPSLPPIGMSIIAIGLALWLSACALFTKENAPKTILTFEQIACIAANAFLDDPSLNAICNLLTGDQQRAGAKLATVNRATVAKQLASRASASTCGDAGADATSSRVDVDGGAR